MHSGERKPRLLMPLVHLAVVVPLLRRVAFGAGIGKLPVMHIEMAVLALRSCFAEVQAGVAGRARHLRMTSPQWKARGLMVEGRIGLDRSPAICRMTVPAVKRKPAVRVVSRVGLTESKAPPEENQDRRNRFTKQISHLHSPLLSTRALSRMTCNAIRLQRTVNHKGRTIYTR